MARIERKSKMCSEVTLSLTIGAIHAVVLMAKNKKFKKTTNKLLVGQPLRKALSQSVLKAFASKSSKGVPITGLSDNSVEPHMNCGSAQESAINDDRLDRDCMDHSLTREPINLGVKNVQQILNCIKDSSLEVKDLILNECNIIYECKVCTNLFRSLANFLSHKRVYCKKHFCERMLLFDSTHFQFNDYDDDNNGEDHEVEEEEAAGDHARTPEPVGGTLPVIEIVSPTSSSATNSSTENINPNNESIVAENRNFMDKCVKKVNEERQRQDECNELEVQLTGIKTNPNAMFQSIQNNELKTECNQHIVDKKKILSDLFKDAKNSRQLSESQTIKRQRVEEILPPTDCSETDVNGCDRSPTNETPNVCDVCESSFTSTKTLRVHMKTIHSTTRLVYPCPLCSLVFKQLSNATRHLIQIHKRTKTQTNSLKEIMKHRAYQTNSSENSSEVEDMSDEEVEEEVITNMTSNDCVNQNKCITRSVGNENSRPTERVVSAPRKSTSCVYKCGNFFDWAPAKRSHEKSCRKRLLVENLTNGAFDGSSKTQSESNESQELSTVPNPSNCSSYASSTASSYASSTASSNTTPTPQTNLILPNDIEEQIKEFTDLKSLQCIYCPTQDFMNLNQLLQHAVTHIGFSIYKCHGCTHQSIFETDMKYHLMNNHNIKEHMIDKHYQTLPNFKQPRLMILPVPSTNRDTNTKPSQPDSPQSPERNSKLKIHLRTSATKLGNTSKKCYEIVDK
ncbi:unnamed protein product [Oppiella nova]|uniref:C2H2-type domain-containing protein n=1 Tax=Oppiella nova TaxID=334625 RepID=A0A7R9LND2_9ACAR|nr:unnamed protein product [Oppiella nova]CAG2165268.1 unnamed protein product [Oppiella nova]